MDLNPDVERLFAAQSGLATREQLYALGVSREALRWRVGRSWTAVLGSVVSGSRERLSPRQRLMAAQLEAGPAGIITGVHACLAQGLSCVPGNRPVLVLVPMNQAARRLGWVDIRRTRRPELSPRVDGPLTFASLPRAVLDAARAAHSLDEARAVVIEAAQRGRCTLDSLEQELVAGSRRGSAFARRALADARDEAWSVPEATLLRACQRSCALSTPVANPVVTARGARVVSPDLWFDDVGLAVMVHSRQHHERGEDWQRTVERDAELTLHGVTVLGFTPRSIATDIGRVVATIESTYARLAATGQARPDVRATPRQLVGQP